MGCPHCLQDSKPSDTFMSWETVQQTYAVARKIGCHVLIVSGGEPTEHPRFGDIIDVFAQDSDVVVMIASNGDWADDDEKFALVESLLDKHPNLFLQITSIEGIYPRRVNMGRLAALPRTDCFTGKLEILALGRAATNKAFAEMAENSIGTTSCFSSALIAAQQPLCMAVGTMELMGKFCHPAVDFRGRMHWSESWLCPHFADVTEPWEDIVRKAGAWRPCGHCKGYRKLQAKTDYQYIQGKKILGIA